MKKFQCEKFCIEIPLILWKIYFNWIYNWFNQHFAKKINLIYKMSIWFWEFKVETSSQRGHFYIFPLKYMYICNSDLSSKQANIYYRLYYYVIALLLLFSRYFPPYNLFFYEIFDNTVDYKTWKWVFQENFINSA